MSEHDIAAEAANALIAIGYKVEPLGNDFASWIVEGKLLTDNELLSLATRLGLMDSPGGLQ